MACLRGDLHRDRWHLIYDGVTPLNGKEISPAFIAKVKLKVGMFFNRHRHRIRVTQDDLFQSVMLKFIEGVRDNSSIEFVCIDILREIDGRKGSKASAGRNIVNGASSFEEIKADQWLESEPFEIIDKITLNQIVSREKSKFQKMLKLTAKGYSPEEIGPKIGVSTTRVYNMMNSFLFRMEKYR